MTVTPAMASRIEMWPLERLTPYAKNARTHSDAQVAQIAASIVEFGFTAPLLVSEDGGILAGHGRLAAARKLDLDAVPVVVLDHLTPTQRRAYILADNQLALQAGWDQELLAVELADLSAAGFDLALTGFSDEELADLLGDIEETERADEAAPIAEPEDEDIPDAPATPVSQPGDIWQLGAHRLICGDSTDPSMVAALMVGDQKWTPFLRPVGKIVPGS
jgi:ParB-like chromosome segregation protein Spo0J